jgi:murein DD-endopeptidase MepM/ murein hydrolase activator NlpD
MTLVKGKEWRVGSKGWRVKGGGFCFLLVLLFTLYPSLTYAAPQLIVSTTTLVPGTTLRVELDDISPADKLKAVFRGKSYAFFPVGPNAQRALIGVALGSPAGDYQLKIRRSGAPNEDLPGLAPMAVSIATHTYVIENINLPKEKNKLVPAEGKESAKIHKASQMLTARQYWEGTFMPPVPGVEIAAFGKKRVHNGNEPAGFHNGIDLRAAAGTPVSAANAGIIIFATPFKAHGRTILINHGQGVMTVYLHMQSFAVKPGQLVTKGQIIGRVGSSGVSTGAHIHWQVFLHGVPVDPKQWQETEF